MITLVASCLALALSGQQANPAWAKPILAEFRATGLMPFDAQIPIETRYEVAVYAHAAFMRVKQYIPTAPAPPEYGGKVEKWWLQMDQLGAMFREYRQELANMGVEVDNSLKEIRVFQAKLAPIGHENSYAPEWAQQLTAKMHADRMIVGYPEGGHSDRRPKTRYELAVAAYCTFERMPKALGGSPLSDEEALNFDQCLINLTRLFAEFRRELTAIDVYIETTPDAVNKAIADHRRKIAIEAGWQAPFPDIPASHWAAHAIRDLKKKELVKGYPGGRFEHAL